MTSSLSHAFITLHLSDSALPTGGFAFSGGLECLARMGLIQNTLDLRGYLQAILEQIGDFELPFINSCYDFNEKDREVQLPRLAWAYHATQTAPAGRRASLIQGKNLLYLLESLYCKGNPCRELPVDRTHYTLVCALGCRILGISLADAGKIFLYKALRDQINAAIRLNLLGPGEGNRLQWNLYTMCEQVQGRADGKTYLDACKSAPLLEVAQSYHPALQVKLFQN